MTSMVGDFMTKPLQGSLFRKFRDLIMGLLSAKEVKNVVSWDVVSATNCKGLVHKS
jgi:hypothetical protein